VARERESGSTSNEKVAHSAKLLLRKRIDEIVGLLTLL
jgi:hypothetical protein